MKDLGTSTNRLPRHYLSSLLLVVAAASGREAAAADGYKIYPKFEGSFPVHLGGSRETTDLAGTVTCSAIDSWGQSELIITLPSLDLPIPLRSVSKLFDGDCEGARRRFLASIPGDGITAVLDVRAYDYIEWGIEAEGSRDERLFCHRQMRQFAYLTGHPLLSEKDFQETQAANPVPLDYNYCLTLDQKKKESPGSRETSVATLETTREVVPVATLCNPAVARELAGKAVLSLLTLAGDTFAYVNTSSIESIEWGRYHVGIAIGRRGQIGTDGYEAIITQGCRIDKVEYKYSLE